MKLRVSYSCADLLEEARADFLEFSNIEMYAFLKNIDGLLFLTNYDFIEQTDPLRKEEKAGYSAILETDLLSIIEILKIQDNVLSTYDDIKNAFIKYLHISAEEIKALN